MTTREDLDGTDLRKCVLGKVLKPGQPAGDQILTTSLTYLLGPELELAQQANGCHCCTIETRSQAQGDPEPSLFGYFNRADHALNQKETILSGLVINIPFLEYFRASHEQAYSVKAKHPS